MSDDAANTLTGYLHGNSDLERSRLSVLNELINPEYVAKLELQQGESVLDLASGLGQLTLAMARELGPQGRVLGIELSDEQLRQATDLVRDDGADLCIEFRKGDATRLPLQSDERASFDVVHARFLLEHLTDPKLALREILAAVKPNGRILLCDDDHDVMRVYPEPEGFYELWNGHATSYRAAHKDPYIGRKLPALLHDVGVTPIRNELIFFGGVAGTRDFELAVQNLIGLFAGSKQALMHAAQMSDERFEASLAALREWGKDQRAAIWYGFPLVEGRAG